MASIIKADTLQSTTANVFILNSSGTEYARFNSSGNLGIGTASSLSKLTALGTTSIVTNGASTRNPVASLRGGNDNNRLDMYVDNSGGTVIIGLGAYNVAGGATAMTFYTGASVSEAMRIDSSGNVGIGTSSPNSIANYSILQVGGSSTTQGYIETYDGTTRTVMWTTGGVGKIGTRTSHPLTFQINSSEVARIDTSGNLQFNSGYGSVATAYGCRAWCYFNGSQAISASGNFSSVTVNATGDIWLNFTNSMPDANYATLATTNEDAGTPKWINATQPATNRIRVVTFNSAGTKVNNTYNYVAVFR